MKICVINGSPKGAYSITLQTALYLQKRFPAHAFSFVHAGQRIAAMEKDPAPALDAIREAELVLFCYPVYTFLAPSQLHRFISLLKRSGLNLGEKTASQITTSKHFYDTTAHRYVEDNCHDLGFRVVRGLSADMDDLLTEAGRHDAEAFFRYAVYCAENGISEPTPEPPRAVAPCAASLPDEPKQTGFDTVIVADVGPDDASLEALLADFRAAYPYPARLVNIADFPFAGGCLGCFHCAGDGACVYRDGFDRFLRERVQTADAVVCAFAVRDHSMGCRFKCYDDRQFCNGHRTVTEGKPFAFLAFGDMAREENLRTVIEARCEVGHNFFCGIGESAETVRATAARLAYALEHRYVQPRNFYGVGGMKIFRDLIWGTRGLMKADHQFYKKHGLYDFPQKKRGQMIKMLFLGALVRNPKVRAKMGNKMNEGMVAPYRKAIDAARAEP